MDALSDKNNFEKTFDEILSEFDYHRNQIDSVENPSLDFLLEAIANVKEIMFDRIDKQFLVAKSDSETERLAAVKQEIESWAESELEEYE